MSPLLEPAPGLLQFGSCPQADLAPFTLASPLEAHPQGAGGGLPEGRLVPPGQVGEVPSCACVAASVNCATHPVCCSAGDTLFIGACYIKSHEGEGGRFDT